MISAVECSFPNPKTRPGLFAGAGCPLLIDGSPSQSRGKK